MRANAVYMFRHLPVIRVCLLHLVLSLRCLIKHLKYQKLGPDLKDFKEAVVGRDESKLQKYVSQTM